MRTMQKLMLAGFLAVMCMAGLPGDATASAGNWVRVEASYSDFGLGAATTATSTLYRLPRAMFVERVLMRLDTVFKRTTRVDAGPNPNTATIKVGDGSTADKFVTATNVWQGATTGWGAGTTIGSTNAAMSAAGTIVATLTTDENTSGVTQGKATFYILVSSVPPG